MRRSIWLPTTVLFFTSILWGLSWMPLKALADLGFDSLQIIGIAYATLLMFSLPLAQSKRRFYKGNMTALAGIFFAGGLANVCFNYALIQGEVLRVMALFYLLPVWGVLGGRFILKEHTSVWRWLGVVLALCGAGILLQVHTILQQAVSWIDVIAIASGLFFAATILLFRGVESVPLVIKLNTLFAGGCLLSVVALLFTSQSVGFALTPNFFWIVAFALGWLAWANLGSQWACTVLPAGRSSIIMVMELVAASVSAVLIGGETLTPSLLIGGALIFSATLIEIFQQPSEVV
jgi:drug/metabolite transporter (DMT)-like permease